ncbi:MAG TPA: zf-HC2 domain-containing protein [Ignavibacteria bacterium]|nr:zf-HC2 domain-containing protein [Ignavibacteria bacterium]
MSTEKATCKEVMNHICDNLGEDLDSPRCVAIKSHLDSCDSCKKYFTSVETTIQFYKKYNVEVDDNTHKRLLDFLGLED